MEDTKTQIRLLLESLPAGAVYREGDSVFLNRAAGNITGYSGPEIRTVEEWFRTLHGEKADEIRTRYEEDRKAGFPVPRTVPLKTKDGLERYVEISANYHYQAEIWLLHDITVQKADKETLEKYRILFSEINDLAYICDNRGNVLFVNHMLDKLTGHKPEEFIGKPFAPLFNDENLKLAMDAYSNTLNGESTKLELEFKDTGMLCEFKNIPLKDAQGNVTGILGIARDITERKKAENTLKKLAYVSDRTGTEYFQSIAALISDELQTEYVIIGRLDADRNKVETITAYAHGKIIENIEYDLHGTPCDNVMGKQACIYPDNIQELFPEDTLLVDMKAESYAGTPLFASTGQPLGIIATLGCKPMSTDEKERCISLLQILSSRVASELERREAELKRETIIAERTAELNSTVELLRNEIDERRLAENRLRETNQFLETILDHTHMLVAYLDADFNFIKVNRAYAEADEKDVSFYPGKNHFDLFPNKENEEIFRNVAESGEPYFTYSKPFEYAENLERGVSWWDWSLIPVKNSENKVTGLILTLTNVTERKWAEEELKKAKEEIETWNRELEIRVREKTDELEKSHAQLIQAERLSLMGKMAAGLAHELNSPLGGLLPLLEAYRKRVRKDTRDYRELTLMLKATEHMARIVKDFSVFSRQKNGTLEKLSLNEAIKDTLNFSAVKLRHKGIRIIEEFEDRLPLVHGNRTELQQVVLNMIMNAADALSEGGHLVIRTGWSEDRNRVKMVFEDNGAGIDEEHLGKIFEPFFTTKTEGKGTGLGLMISYGIIQKHGGEISVKSEKGEGTVFTIYLPAQ